MFRRKFLSLIPAGLCLPQALFADTVKPFRIRTITAGLSLNLRDWEKQLQQTVAFLNGARSEFSGAGYEVQTLRIATQPLPEYLHDWSTSAGLAVLSELDNFCQQENVILSIGPVAGLNEAPPNLADWAAELIDKTQRINFSVAVAAADTGVRDSAVQAAAATIAAVARTSAGGEGNFRFAATANCPPGTPFFPAAWHRGRPAFAIGLETPKLLLSIIETLQKNAPAAPQIAASMSRVLAPVEAHAKTIAKQARRSYLGIDTSPAPAPTASIGEAIEALTGVPFGSASTLGACASITTALKSLQVKTCGYSGLMLPVLEDKVLAKRAAEGRYGISELLLYSSVCGTGLDVVPLPGDSSVTAIAAIISDVAALSAKYEKALSARLFPVPGKKVGEAVSFDNPFLTDSVVMALD